MLMSFEIDGTVHCVADPTIDLEELGEVTLRRASHVLPLSPPLQFVFKGLRALFGEKGRVANWTRSWKCHWVVDLSPSGGPYLGPFTDRSKAIADEVMWLEEHITSVR